MLNILYNIIILKVSILFYCDFVMIAVPYDLWLVWDSCNPGIILNSNSK